MVLRFSIVKQTIRNCPLRTVVRIIEARLKKHWFKHLTLICTTQKNSPELTQTKLEILRHDIPENFQTFCCVEQFIHHTSIAEKIS